MKLKLQNNEQIKNILIRYKIDLNLVSTLDEIKTTQYIAAQLTKGIKKLKTVDDVRLFINDIKTLSINVNICKNKIPYEKVIWDINTATSTRINILTENKKLIGSCYIVNLHKYFMISI